MMSRRFSSTSMSVRFRLSAFPVAVLSLRRRLLISASKSRSLGLVSPMGPVAEVLDVECSFRCKGFFLNLPAHPPRRAMGHVGRDGDLPVGAWSIV